MWFTRNGDHAIARIAVDGGTSAFELPQGSAPFGIVAGPDDALWYTTMGSERVGRITTAGEIEEFPAPGMPSMIASGPDGALWFTLNQGNAIGRIDTQGRITTRKLETPSAGPVGIAATHDGAVWFRAWHRWAPCWARGAVGFEQQAPRRGRFVGWIARGSGGWVSGLLALATGCRETVKVRATETSGKIVRGRSPSVLGRSCCCRGSRRPVNPGSLRNSPRGC